MHLETASVTLSPLFFGGTLAYLVCANIRISPFAKRSNCTTVGNRDPPQQRLALALTRATIGHNHTRSVLSSRCEEAGANTVKRRTAHSTLIMNGVEDRTGSIGWWPGGGGGYFLGVRASRGLYRHIVEQIASVTEYHSTIAPGSGSPGQVFTASTVTSRPPQEGRVTPLPHTPVC